jgi:hypothetical protein
MCFRSLAWPLAQQMYIGLSGFEVNLLRITMGFHNEALRNTYKLRTLEQMSLRRLMNWHLSWLLRITIGSPQRSS